MKKIKYIKGDATKPIGEGLKVISHINNTIGGWGSGFVLAISARWSQPEKSYRALKEYNLGDVEFIQVEDDVVVANMIAQAGTINRPSDENLPPIRYKALRNCLHKVNKYCIKHNATLHAPRFGSGLAGGDWNIIEDIIKDVMEVEVTIYDFN